MLINDLASALPQGLVESLVAGAIGDDPELSPRVDRLTFGQVHRVYTASLPALSEAGLDAAYPVSWRAIASEDGEPAAAVYFSIEPHPVDGVEVDIWGLNYGEFVAATWEAWNAHTDIDGDYIVRLLDLPEIQHAHLWLHRVGGQTSEGDLLVALTPDRDRELVRAAALVEELRSVALEALEGEDELP